LYSTWRVRFCGFRKKLIDSIGYALGACQTADQQKLLNAILHLKYEKIICIFSKATWKNEQFIFNIPVKTIILPLFDIAIQQLCGCFPAENGKTVKNTDVGSYLEFILAVFRLRNLNDPEINDRLSLNHPLIQDLYACIEKIAQKKLSPRTMLILNVKKNSGFQDIPDIIYAVACYITGEMGEGDIVISGLNEGEDSHNTDS